MDDIVLAGVDEDKIKFGKSELSSKFDIKDLGKLKYFLGMTVIQDKERGLFWMGQPAYVKTLLEKFNMSDCKPVGTPVDVSSKLVKATDVKVSMDQQLNQSAVGSLKCAADLTLHTQSTLWPNFQASLLRNTGHQ